MATEEMMLEPGRGRGKGVRRERKGGRERERETEVEGVSEGMTETEGGIFCRKHKERDTPLQPPHQVQKETSGDQMGQEGARGSGNHIGCPLRLR